MAAVVAFVAAPAWAFDSKGHVVIEALAYRTLAEGYGGRPPQPDVLRDLLNDGALAPPLCFGWEPQPPGFCRDAATSNPLLDWPRPRTDQPDAAFRRQFSDPGQCFHFMAMLEDAESEKFGDIPLPRALATTAIVRCRDLLDDLLRQIVIDGGPGTRRGAYGLYELMHAVGDSFSGSHAERRAGTAEIESLRVWKPLETISRLPTERSARIPKMVYHEWNDHRDKTYVQQEREAGGGRRCKELTDEPYSVPFECLSEEGDQARRALTELLVIVRDLRAAQLAAPDTANPSPEQSEPWRIYKEKWFAMVHACQGEECAARQPADLLPGAYGLIGLDTTYNATRRFVDIAARGSLLKYSSELNPFIYSVGAELGYRLFTAGGGAGLAGLELDLILPLGKRAAIGFVPAAWRVTFGSDHNGSEVTTRLLRFDYRLGDRLFLTLNAPVEVNWRKPAVEWSIGLGLSYAPGSSQAAADSLLQRHSEKVERQDESWAPPPAPYGRLKGRASSWYVEAAATVVDTPPVSIPDVQYGLGTIGAAVMWDRDRWGSRFAFAPGASLGIGARLTSGDSAYLTGVLGAGLRWYCLGILGLSVTPVRIEGGPKIRGKEEFDTSPDVHGPAGSQYYFQAGSRVGIALNVGIIDLLVEAPTLTWRSTPFGAGEILSFRFGIRLN